MRPFSLLVKPSGADCNLRCRYCFYLKKCDLYPDQRTHRMPREVAERMISTFLATQQPHHSIGWQGGEPTLMGLDFFKFVTDMQKKHGRPGQLVSNGLQTNGTLIDDSWARHIAEYNFLCGISLDGPEVIHNASRVNLSGRGSHADVLRGIDCLRRNNAEFNILTLVNRMNVDKPRDIYRYMVENGFLFQQYVECVEFDAKGELRPYAVTGAEWGEFICGIFDEWKKTDVRRVSVRLFDSVLTKLVDGIANVCAMDRNCCQYLVVEHNGDVYPCDFFVEPGLKLGNVMENTWEECLDSPVYKEFGARKMDLNAECPGCEYFSLCSGDCPKNRFRHGVDPRQLSNLCEGWKLFYSHTSSYFMELAAQIKSERKAAAQTFSPVNGTHPSPPERPGRNDPCICGSGKKFKKCCGR